MTIIEIEEIQNDTMYDLKPIKEVMDIYVPDIIDNVSRRNGMIYILTGSGGSGKSSLLLSFFQKASPVYRNKFNNIYYICPESSYLSVKNHPFRKHDKIYHELSLDVLENIYSDLIEIKEDATTNKKKQKYNLVIIDDYADNLKNKSMISILNKLLIKARHLNCSFIFTLQSYFYFPKILRKQITYCTIFKPKNVAEFETLSKELFNMKSEDALKLFNFVFDAQYNHLDVDTVLNKYYKNFNELILTEK